MELDLSSGYLQMCWERKKTYVACMDIKGKMVKTYEDHKFLLGTRNWENK
jgi:hypothetical protein